MAETNTFSFDFLNELGIKELNDGTSTGQKFFSSNNAESKEIFSPVDGKLIAKVKFTTEEENSKIIKQAQ